MSRLLAARLSIRTRFDLLYALRAEGIRGQSHLPELRTHGLPIPPRPDSLPTVQQQYHVAPSVAESNAENNRLRDVRIDEGLLEEEGMRLPGLRH